MFKAMGNLIHKTPWWALVLGGIAMLLALVLFAVPMQVIRLSDSGTTKGERRAIEREINLAIGDRALDFAQGVVGAMKERASDPDRLREFDRALAEIARARSEMAAAQNDNDRTVRESARDATEAALETAAQAAESLLESAVEAREAIQEAKDDAIDKLRNRTLDIAPTAKSFDDMLKTAGDNERAARESLAAILALHRSSVTGALAGIHLPPVIQIGQPALPEGLRGEIRSKVAGDVWRVGVGSALILAFIPLFVMLLISKYFLGRSRRALAFAEEKKQEAQLSDVSRQITEARLQALQAQVEPHFLYNTLANVQALTEVDPPAAHQMVGHLIQYLRASLPKMREKTSTVGQEVELVRAYLNILQMRMGARLAFTIAVPDDLLGTSFPPMMLPSLVENAIKHGLEPQREGGRIEVTAERVLTPTGEHIRLQVKDTGKGLTDGLTQGGAGVGLSNLRERLAAIYGDKGRFSLESNLPRGVIATVDIPAEVPKQEGAAPATSGAAPAPKAERKLPQTPWHRAWRATSKTHGVWARVVSRTFMALMIVLCVTFALALIGLYSGWLPVQVGDLHLDGLEGMAIGSVGLLIAFGAIAIAILMVVAVLYGLGFLLAGVLIVVPVAILISLFPVLSPFILIGLGLYWFLKKRDANEK